MPPLSVRNPYDDTLLGELKLSSEQTIDDAIVKCHAAFQSWRFESPSNRSALLFRVVDALRSERREFADLICAEAGKPITFAEIEVDRALNTLTAAAELARSDQTQTLDLAGYTPGVAHTGIVKRFPIGVVYGMTPFNFPLNLVLHKVAPAIASGNAILIKPSPRTPLTALKLQDLFARCDAPAGLLSVVVCSNELAMRPILDPRIAHVSFTGSDTVGRDIRKAAWEKRVTLELGGNAAVIVHDDANLADAIPLIATGAFGYAGQSCISVQRIIVHASIYESLRARLIDHIREKVRTGDPRDRSVINGPLIDDASRTRIDKAVRNAVAAGAKVLCGGESSGRSYLPTVLEDVTQSMDVVKTEIFGPIATLQSYRSFDEALKLANDSRFGLQAGVFTRDLSRAQRAFERLDVGGVLINQVPTWRVETMPYGGVKASGFGREGVAYAMAEMTELKSMIVRHS